MSKSELYNLLCIFGDIFEINFKLKNPKSFVDWTESNFTYVKYNPRKDIARYGLSITSLDGNVTGVPDLDSLHEYNTENNTSYKEKDFNVFTPVYEYKNLQECLKEFEDDIYRTHILKLESGGFFPPHRDIQGMDFSHFRLIVPLENVNPPSFNFVVDNKIVHWNLGQMYFVNTAKMHYLFNSSFKPSYWLIINIDVNEKNINKVLKNVVQK